MASSIGSVTPRSCNRRRARTAATVSPGCLDRRSCGWSRLIYPLRATSNECPRGQKTRRSRLRSAERNFLSGAARAVHGVDELQSLVSFFARDQRLAPRADRLAKIAELTLERFDRNCHRIGCPRSYFFRNRRRLAGIVL